MADDKTSKSTPAGLYLATQGQSTQAIEWLGVALAILWLCVSGYILMMPIEGNANMLASMLIVFMPVAILWLAVIVIRTSQKMRQESQKLHVAIEALRKAYIDQSKMNGAPATEASVTRKLDSIAESQRKTETAIAMFTSTRLAEAQNAAIPNTAQPQAEHQPVLALGTPVEELAPPLAKPDFIRALNFPENANDEEGFNALRRALKDRSVAQLVQASQDILTLLSQDGIYMDDLRPDMARPEIWRRFAKGERGRTIAALGGIRDRSSLALTNVRMKKDPVFRDAAHHFLRLFDRGFSKFEESATETEISALSETRTARAFMLLGRVAGTFD
jgi:uncharacterized membrane protein